MSNSPPETADPGTSRAKAKPGTSASEARLVFMFAQQTIQQWQFLADGYLPGTGTVSRSEIERGLAQLSALVTRIQPLARSRTLAIRFEAEELLQLLTKAVLELEALRAAEGAELDTSLQSAVDIKSRLTARLRGKRVKRQS